MMAVGRDGPTDGQDPEGVNGGGCCDAGRRDVMRPFHHGSLGFMAIDAQVEANLAIQRHLRRWPC